MYLVVMDIVYTPSHAFACYINPDSFLILAQTLARLGLNSPKVLCAHLQHLLAFSYSLKSQYDVLSIASSLFPPHKN